jgi:hypothetical protein
MLKAGDLREREKEENLFPPSSRARHFLENDPLHHSIPQEREHIGL